MPLTNRFGSKLGTLTIASTSPLRGSIATAAPARPSNAASAASCRCASIVRYRFAPGFGAMRGSSTRIGAMVGVDFDLLVARLAVQLVLVEALDAGLADVRRAGVLALVEPRQRRSRRCGRHSRRRARTPAPSGYERVRYGTTSTPGKRPAVDREACDLVFGQLQAQRNALERALAPAQRVEALRRRRR